MTSGHPGRRRVAVIGSGVSGLVAGWLLAKDSHVTLYEADERLGGHADTHDVEVGEHTVPVDTGFIVHNERTYPTLLRLFDELGVGTQESDMSMSVRDDESGLEWAGALGAGGLFPRGENLRNPRYLRMLTEIPRFHRMAKQLLAAPEGFETGLRPSSTTEVPGEENLETFLERGGFSDFFVTYFMTPLVSAVWSTDPDNALDYPARYLFRFLEHHGMLTVFGSPTWRTVVGGSREYVEKVAKRIDEVRLSSPVTDVREHADGVDVTDASGTTTYDAVVVATHPEQALSMLEGGAGGPRRELLRELLGAMRYEPNVAQLHTDERLLPRAEKARASWNYQMRGPAGAPEHAGGRVLVTYDMTRLQRISSVQDRRFLVTLGGADIVDPATVIDTMHYAHPIYTPESVAAQQRLGELSTSRVALAGAYHGWGFHEDGALSGRHAAEHLGAVWPERGRVARPAPTPRMYRTTIKHARVEPKRNIFSYSSYTWLVDLDDLPRYAGALAPVLRRLASFEARDHVGDPERSIRENIDTVLAEHGIELGAGGRVQMLAHARTLGYVFNPISVFWCHRADSGADHTLAAVVVEVHNTYGGRHAYVVHPDEHGRATVDKQLYVSPFNDTSGTYHVAVPTPGETMTVGVTLHRESRPPFTATMTGEVGPADPRAVVRAALRSPVVPLLGMARIKFQGIKLWLRGLKIQPRPEGDNHDQ